MKYLKRYIIFTEGRVTDLSLKYKEKGLSDEVINYFLLHDPTKNKSYVDWMCDRYMEMTDVEIKSFKGDLLATIIRMITKYENVKFKLKEKDRQINRIKSIKDLSNILNQDKNWLELNNRKDAKVLYQSYEWIVFIPYSKEVSKEFGDKSWCTVSDPNKHFRKHFGEYGALIYFINKLNSSYNFAMEEISPGLYNVWDQTDDKIVKEKSKADIIYSLDNAELKNEWNNIKITPAKITQNEYREVFIKHLKDMGLQNFVDNYGLYIIRQSMNNNLISFEFVSKLKKRFKNMIKKSIKNLDIDDFLEHITRYTNYTWNDIDELGTEKIIDNLFKNNMIDKLLNKYNIGFDDFLTYFDIKNDKLTKEAEEFLESVIDWDDIYEKLLIEIDEDDYFKYLPSV